MRKGRTNEGAWKNNDGRKKLVERIDEECGKRVRRRKACREEEGSRNSGQKCRRRQNVVNSKKPCC